MKDNDELFTIEINVNPHVPERKKDEPAKESNEQPESARGQFVLFDEAERKRQEQKHKEYLRLRESIFNRNRGPVNSTFLQQATQYADEEGEPTDFVPFSCYWPTYDVMSDAQLKWYLYWRSQVRGGVFPQTALSYIFIYVYEIINEVGIEDKEDGLVKLCNVWGEYRAYYSNLDRYLSSWVSDFIAIHFPGGLPDGMLEKITSPEVIARLPDNIVTEHFLNADEPDEYGVNVFDLLMKYSNYKIKSSKFYQAEQFMTEYYLTDVFKFLNKYIKKKNGQGIFETYKTTTTQKKMPYQNAVYQGSVKWIESRADDYIKNKALQNFITAVIKETENCLRAIVGYKGKLKSGLDDEYARVLRKFIKEKYNNKKIEEKANIRIDKSKIKELIDHSKIIRDKLLADNPESEPEIADEKTEAVESAQVSEPVENTVVRSTDDPHSELTARLSDMQRRILGFIMENNGTVSTSALADAFGGVFVDMEIDSINEAAMDCLGDILLLYEGENIILQE
jgi:hypothetical protein